MGRVSVCGTCETVFLSSGRPEGECKALGMERDLMCHGQFWEEIYFYFGKLIFNKIIKTAAARCHNLF